MAALPIMDKEMPHSNDLVDRMSYLLETGYLSDCSFEVGDDGKLFRCHKIILITASPVFRAMFDGPMSNENVVKIVDTSSDSFELFLRYIYTNSLKLESFELIYDFLCLSNKYMVSFPQQPCIDYLVKDRNNICNVYELAKLLDMKKLIDDCIEIFRKETHRILSGSGFLTAQPETVKVIFEQDELNVANELDLFLAIEKYAKRNQCGNPKSSSLIKDAVKNIRFLRILPKDFSRVVAKSDLLNQEEKLSILCCLNAEDDSMEMPEGFNNIRKCRQPLTRLGDADVRILRNEEYALSINDIDHYYSFSLNLDDHESGYIPTYLDRIDIPTRTGIYGIRYREEFNVKVYENNAIKPLLVQSLLQKSQCLFNSTVTVNFDTSVKIMPSTSYEIKIFPKNYRSDYPFGDFGKSVEITRRMVPRVVPMTGLTLIRSVHLRCLRISN